VKKREQKVIVEESAGMDELYGEWFVCPKCSEAGVFWKTNFCPDCGVELDWSKVDKKRKGGQ